MTTNSNTDPTNPDYSRLSALDTLRGLAVIGILPVNLLLFGWPEVMLFNPTAVISDGALDWSLWIITHLFFEQKFYTLLSLVFGASLLLFEAACKRRNEDPKRQHNKRMLTLGVLGLIHAYGLWFGDILYFYALCGMLAWWMRQRPVHTLLWSGVLLMAIPALMLVLLQWSINQFSGDELISELETVMHPDIETLSAEIAAYQGTWWEQMPYRASAAAESQWAGFLAMGLWKTWGLMLWGMAFWRLGIWQQTAFNVNAHKLALFGMLPLGLTLTTCGLIINLNQGFQVETALFAGQLWNYVGSLFTALGYAALVLRWLAPASRQTQPLVGALNDRLQSVGRMALTAYLTQTLIATTIFYGHGFGQYGQWSLGQGWLVVLAIWAFLLWLAPWYLRRHALGPMEWLWRRLSR